MAKVSLERKEMARASRGGVLAGVAGGVFLSLLLLVVNVVKGQNLWPALKGAAAPFYGERVMSPGFDLEPVAVGLLVHLAVSIAWGWLFAVIFYGLSRQATLAAGLLWGVVVWLGMFYVVLPLVGLGEMARGAPVAFAIVEHVLFGLVVAAAFLPYQRRVQDRWPPLRRHAASA